VNEEGKYCVRLFDIPTQEWKEYVIDDRIAMLRPGSRRPKGVCIPDDGGVWPILLEKAFCIHAGGWDKIIGGKSCLAFHCMTGVPEIYGIRNVAGDDPEPKYKWLEYNWSAWTDNTFFCKKEERGESYAAFPNGEDSIDVNTLFDFMTEWNAKNYVMCAATRSGSDEDATDGIVDGHAYSLLEVKKDVCGKGFDLLCFRNPHGKNGREWKGAWSDSDSAWDENPDVAEELGNTVCADSKFWMAKDDAFKYFRGFFVCMKEMPEPANKQCKPVQPGVALENLLGVWVNQKNDKEVTISEEDGQVTIDNPGYPKTYPADVFLHGGICNYYGLQGLYSQDDTQKVISWSNGVDWTCAM
jgi:hypothetical protein